MAEIITLPKMSDTMEEGTLVKWHIKLGDNIKAGDILAEIETDKATMDLESYYDGEVLYLGANEGDKIKIDAPILVIGEKGEDYKSLIEASGPKKQYLESSESNNIDSISKNANQVKSQPKDLDKENNLDRIKASPLAKKIAKDKGLDLSTIKASTSSGRVIKRDIEKALSPLNTSGTENINYQLNRVSDDLEYKDEPLTQMRKVIAERLSQSKFSAPHFYVKQEINVDSLVSLRFQINEKLKIKISFNDLIVKAIACAIAKHPEINTSFLGDKIRYYENINIGVAVAVDDGLVVPVIRKVNEKSISQISTEIKSVAAKAREKKITPLEMQGSSFTISNLGMYGIKEFTSIINPPNSCILAIGAITKIPVVDDDDNIKSANMLTVVLSADHRVVDGVKGAIFLQTLKNILQEPLELLV
ncbi:MAG: dihydrolipoamide acetyltransferase family protein [Solitalea-like symbiont of Tyrophagus putrescentiae]